MTPLEPLPIAEWGILLTLAVALGASLYFCILGLSLFPLIPGVPESFGPLALLATPPVMIVAALLYLSVWGVRGHPTLEFLWEFGNIPIRGIAVALLSLLTLGSPHSSYAWAAAVAAGGVAAFIQLLRAGWMLLDHYSDSVPARRWIQKLGGDTAALGLIWLTLVNPKLGPIVSGIAVIGVIVVSRPAFRSGRFTLSLFRGLLRTLTGESGWRDGRDIPGWVRKASAGAHAGVDSTYGTAAAIVWTHRGSTFQDGWLVLSGTGPVLLFRTFSRLWEVSLHGMTVQRISKLPHLTRISLTDSEGEVVLLLPQGGVGGEEVGSAIAGG